jgi:hypothetical protein
LAATSGVVLLLVVRERERETLAGTEEKRDAETTEMEGVEVEEGVMRVLLVDDSPVDRKVAQLLLNSGSCAGSFHGQLSIQLSSCPCVLKSVLFSCLRFTSE